MRRLAAALALLLLATPAAADQTDPRLPELLDALKTAPNAATAAALEQSIWGLWVSQPDPVIATLMDKAGYAMAVDDSAVALRALDQVVVLAPAYAEGWNRRATLYYLMGRYDDSLADIEAVLALEPRHFGALSGRGLCLVELDRPEEALAAFEAALAINPHMEGVKINVEALKKLLGDDI